MPDSSSPSDPQQRIDSVASHLSSSPPPRPAFSSLPVDATGPPGNAWGLYGPKDQLGTLNLLTPSNTIQAASTEIKTGIRVCTDCPLNRFTSPFFGRRATEHQIISHAPAVGNDDELTFNTQSSSQWDGFRHMGWGKERQFLNGVTQDEITKTDVIGIHAWVNNGGIVGRGVLLDYLSYAQTHNLPHSPFKTTSIPVSVIEAMARHQNVSFRRGDILFLRTGWIEAYANLSEPDARSVSTRRVQSGIGIESSEETLRWIWEKEFAAVAGDCPTFEAWPCKDKKHWLHEWLLAGWGTPIGELFDLETLVEECRRQGRWSFFFSSVPLHVPGLVASPPNGVAIF